ncbi:S-adenosyl-L-methionine-dependent methyltransferase [Amylocystis lapponica]|nr:S-adenosyl-L-methionine-dependent methyltransferase [Amylocystis lapponica]
MAFDPSANAYSSLALHFYDFFILTVCNYFAWRCPTPSILLPFFQKNVGENAHLDVGVGTGYYTAASASHLAKTKNVTLLDLRPNVLTFSEQRLRGAGYRGSIDTVAHNVCRPIPDSLRGRFDAVSCFYLLHCLSGVFPVKASNVFANLAVTLAPGGVLYGATILGQQVHHNWFGRLCMRFWNRRGVFGNNDDSLKNLECALRGLFEEVEVKVVGAVALFEARNPLPK